MPQCRGHFNDLRIDNYVFAVCHTLSQGVAALFGPNSPFTAHHVQVIIGIVIRIIISIIINYQTLINILLQSICDSKEIPHIETRWDYRVSCCDWIYSYVCHSERIYDNIDVWLWYNNRMSSWSHWICQYLIFVSRQNCVQNLTLCVKQFFRDQIGKLAKFCDGCDKCEVWICHYLIAIEYIWKILKQGGPIKIETFMHWK